MFKRIVLIIILAILVLGITSYYFFKREKTVDYQLVDEVIEKNEETISIDGNTLVIQIADEQHEQTLGLSGRDKLGPDEGMLFIFPEPGIHSFWMKDMKFALDIIWINADGIIIGAEKNVSPDTYPKTFNPPSPIKYVLEVNAGWIDINNIKIPGTKLGDL